MLKNILLVGLGGFAGSISRYAIYLLLEQRSNGLPFATFVVNMTGSLLLGLFMGYFMSRGIESNMLRLFFAVGFCGSFTTFSTFAMENFQFIHGRQYTHLITYGAGSIVLGIIMVWIGMMIARAL